MLELEAAGIVRVSDGGLEIERAPDGITFEPLADHPRLGELVGADEKFAAHNAAMWEHGLLVQMPKGIVLEQPLYVRVINDVDGGSLFWRLLVVAEPESRFTVIEEYASTGPELSGYVNAAVEIFVGQGAKVEYVSVQNVSQETWHFGTHHARRTGRGARLGRRRLRLEAGEDPDPERPRRPRRDLARDRRLLRGRLAAPRLRHLPGQHRAEHDLRLRVQGCSARQVERGLARDDPRRGGRAEDERLPGEPQPPALPRRTRGLDPGPRDPRERRPLHARPRSARSTATSSST